MLATRTALRATTTLACLLVAAPAFAHTTVTPTEAAADADTELVFSVPHGCDGEPTEALRVQIPDGVVSVKPQVVPDWEIETVVGEYDEPVTLHGQEITEGVAEVVWRGGPLDDGHLQEFGMSVKLPDGEGETLYFPAIQECPGGGEARWIQVPADGEDAEELEEPAPALTLVASSGGHGDKEQPAEADETATENEAVDGGETATSVSGSDTDLAAAQTDPATSPLVWVALVAGLAGTILGGIALVTRRR
jgi:uncharacterized protein YcnI